MTITKINIASKISTKTNLSQDSSVVFFDKFVNILINEFKKRLNESKHILLKS